MYLWALLGVPGRPPVQTSGDPVTLSLVGVTWACILAPVPSTPFFCPWTFWMCVCFRCLEGVLGLSRSTPGNLEATSKPGSLCWGGVRGESPSEASCSRLLDVVPRVLGEALGRPRPGGELLACARGGGHHLRTRSLRRFVTVAKLDVSHLLARPVTGAHVAGGTAARGHPAGCSVSECLLQDPRSLVPGLDNLFGEERVHGGFSTFCSTRPECFSTALNPSQSCRPIFPASPHTPLLVHEPHGPACCFLQPFLTLHPPFSSPGTHISAFWGLNALLHSCRGILPASHPQHSRGGSVLECLLLLHC